MKKIVSIIVFAIGIVSFISCGSTAPCGLSLQKNKKHINYNTTEVLVSEANITE